MFSMILFWILFLIDADMWILALTYVLDLRADVVTSISLPRSGCRALSSGSEWSGLERPDPTLPPGLTIALCWSSIFSYTAFSWRQTRRNLTNKQDTQLKIYIHTQYISYFTRASQETHNVENKENCRYYYTMCASIKWFSLFVLYKIHPMNHTQHELQHVTANIEFVKFLQAHKAQKGMQKVFFGR